MPETFTGKGAGAFIENALKSAIRTVHIVSPWISPEYAKLLVSLAKKGVEVWILTSDSPEKFHQESLAILLKGKIKVIRRRDPVKTFLPIGLGAAVGFLGGPLGSILGAICGCAVGYYWGLSRIVKVNPKLNIKISRKAFVHSKIYIIDGSYAVVGSANLTHAGLWENIETVTIYRDPEEVEEVKKDYLKLWIMA